MLLAIDIGNTSTAIGVYRDSELVSHWRTETKKTSTADEFALLFRKFFEMDGYSFDQIEGIAMSNVVPSVQHAITSMSRRYFNVQPLSVNYENAGIKINYPNPSEIGSDRLANAVSAYERYKGPVITIDFGTATTFDYINEGGEYCGGVITPGIAIANEALYRWTSKLPRVDIVRVDDVLGKSTVSAIQSGVYHGYVGLVAHLVEMMKNEVENSPKVIATGGLASLIVGDLGIEVDKFLTLEGLRIIYNRNSLASKKASTKGS